MSHCSIGKSQNIQTDNQHESTLKWICEEQLDTSGERNNRHNVNIHQRLSMYAAWIPSVCTVQKYSKLKPKFQLPTPEKWPMKSVVGNCYLSAFPRTLPRSCLHWKNETWCQTALSVIGTSYLNSQLASKRIWKELPGLVDQARDGAASKIRYKKWIKPHNGKILTTKLYKMWPTWRGDVICSSTIGTAEAWGNTPPQVDKSYGMPRRLM